jgi:hypothetical protein
MRAALAAPLLCLLSSAFAQAQEPGPWPEPQTTPAPADPAPRPRRLVDPAAPPDEEPLGPPLVWGDEPSFESHVRLSAFWLPGVKVVADRDHLEPDDGLLFHADLRHGSGWGGAFAIGTEHVGVGGLYLFSEHRERRSGEVCRAHAGYLEVTLEVGLPPGGPLLLSLGCGLGLGGAVLDFARNAFDDSGGLSGELRAWVGLRLLERVEVTAGGGGLYWGVPGETIGWGAFATLGVALRF